MRNMTTVVEFGIFAIVLPIILSVLVVGLSLWGGSQAQANPGQVWARMMLLFGPMLIGAITSLLFGILLLAFRTRWAVMGAIVGTAFIPVGYIGATWVLMQRIPVDLLTAALVAGPILMITRSPAAFAELREDAAGGPGAVPPPPPWQR